MNTLALRQSELNRSSACRWEEFLEHRRQITHHLLPDAKAAPGRLCVLGAGNCNDLEFAALRNTFAEIHLVDLDEQALAEGVARQQLAGEPCVRLHGNNDVTAGLNLLAGWHPGSRITDEELDSLRHGPTRQLPAKLGGPFDCVASTCLLSQLVDSVVHSAGPGHPRFVELLQAIRMGHFRLMHALLRTGGTGLLFTDVVSSDSCPELVTIDHEQLPGLRDRLVAARNFFHGVNPVAIEQGWMADPELAGRTELNRLEPWKWNIGPRTYLVCGWRIVRLR